MNEKQKKSSHEQLSSNTNNLAYKQSFENYKTLEMMELVKQLEDLCDDEYAYY